MNDSVWPTTTGIDLASQDGNTAICRISWSSDGASLSALTVGVADDDVLDVLRALPEADRVGVDCPFGWPDRFVRAVGAHAAFDVWPDRGDLGDSSRRGLRYRRTDENVKELYGVTPLSVSSDWIAVVAMRWAGLLDAVHVGSDGPVDRTGNGPIVEVYPAAALKRWGLPHQGYKGDADDVRSKILAGLESRIDGLLLEPQARSRCLGDHNALDALVCAVIARAVAVGAIEQLPPEHRDAATREGWIAVPTEEALTRLVA